MKDSTEYFPNPQSEPLSLVSTVYDRRPITPEQFAKFRPAGATEPQTEIATKQGDATQLAYEGGIAGRAASIIVDRFVALEARVALLEDKAEYLIKLTTRLEQEAELGKTKNKKA